mgnify:CR=1 FL=1
MESPLVSVHSSSPIASARAPTLKFEATTPGASMGPAEPATDPNKKEAETEKSNAPKAPESQTDFFIFYLLNS